MPVTRAPAAFARPSDKPYKGTRIGSAFMQLLRQCATALFLLVVLGQAWAETTVTGTIASSTVWSANQSPYNLQGDVVVDGGATLSIQPGVTVRMAQGASFTLKKGALQAVGTAAKPIVITSSAASPAAGDWRQWRLTAGTASALTQLAYVTMEYGSGLVIESASPVITNTAINHHSAPAISIDLASSPAGAGNSASGNSVNAVAVPAGTIRSQVVWGLVGIPYLVQQGLVQVGQAPLSLEPAKLKLSPGVVALLRVSLSAPATAPGAVIDVISSVPSVASAVSRVTVATGETGADLEVQASTVGTTRITASNAALGYAETQVEVVNLPSLGLASISPTVGVNRAYPMTVSLAAPAGAGGVAVQLSNSDAAVLSAPSSLLVPAGQQNVSFEVTGLVDGTSRIAAQADGYASALTTVSVRGKALILPSSVIVAPGGQTTVNLTITEPAPAAGLSVSLALEQSGLAQAPATVQVPAGQSNASFAIQGTALGTTNLLASATGYQAAKTVLRVDAISLNTDPAVDIVMNAEQSRSVRVLLSKVAPPGGVTVSVSSRNTAVASVTPAEVVVPEGQIYATVPLTVKALGEGQTVLDVTSPGLIAKAVNVAVGQKIGIRLTRRGGEKLIVGKGLTNYYYEFYVERLIDGAVSAGSGADAVTVNLRCASEAICKTPATVTIPAGQSSTYIQVAGVDVGSTQIEATAQGATAAMSMPVDVVQPQITFNSLDKDRTTSSVRDDFSISLNVPGAYYSGSQAAVSAMTVNLSLTDQAPAGVVNGFYSAGSGSNLIAQLTIYEGNAGTRTAYVAQPSTAGTYRVSAEIAGISSTKSEVQTVTAASQSLKLTSRSGAKLIVGKGLINYYYEFYVERLVNGVVSTGADAVTVSLRCASETTCKTPATATIPAGQSSTYIAVEGVDIGSTQIEATAQGATAAAPMPVDVVQPQITFNSLDGNRTTSSVRDDFSISLRVPGAYYSGSQTAVSAITVYLSLTDQTPAGVVNGFYSAASGGSLITQLTIYEGNAYASAGYVAQPSTAGTYRVSAEIAGISSAKSEVQTVTAATQSLELTRRGGAKLIVGKGLTSYYYEFYVARLVNGIASPGAEAVMVNPRCVSEAICKTPATVTIPAGESYTYIQVAGVSVGSTQIEATAQGATAATPVPVEVVLPQILFNSLDGNRTTSSVRDDFSISLRVPGAYYLGSQMATSAMTVNLSLTDQAPAGVVNGFYNAPSGGSLITQLTVYEGTAYASAGYVAQPSTSGTYRVSAEITGISSAKSEVQTVTGASQSLKLTRRGGAKLIVGKGLTNYYYEFYVERLINGAVSSGADAVTVNLRCVSEAICKTPTTVTIPAGESYAYIQVAGVDVGSTQIEAAAAGFEAGYINQETVTPALYLQNVPTNESVGATYDYITVTAQVNGAYYSGSQTPANPVAVTFTSSVPSVGTVTSTVNWTANAGNSDYATFTAVAAGTTQITASSPGFAPATSAPITVAP